MRIKEIKIEGLFGMFNHAIPLNLQSHLTIIYGINGIGKTMLFKILDSYFGQKAKKGFDLESKFSFDTLTLLLEDDTELIMNETGAYLLENDEEVMIMDENEEFNRIDFAQIKQAISVYFIQTQRLLTINQAHDSTKVSVHNTISTYAAALSRLIKSKNQKYRELSDNFKSSLGKRVLDGEVRTDFTIQELRTLAQQVKTKRQLLHEVGLIELNADDTLEIPNDITDLNRAILAVNIQDVQKQLTVFDERNFYQRLKLFIDILNNRRLSYKQISITEQNGFVFTNTKGKNLQPSDLSSGEQHEVVLLYQLLFEIPTNALVLIDEPEISLHIVWQKAFVEDMEEIIKLRQFDVLVATHSPSIINGNWDLTVSLKGIEHEEAIN